MSESEREHIGYFLPHKKGSSAKIWDLTTKDKEDLTKAGIDSVTDPQRAYETAKRDEMESTRKEAFACIFEVLMEEAKTKKPVEQLLTEAQEKGASTERLQRLDDIKRFFPNTYNAVKEQIDAITK